MQAYLYRWKLAAGREQDFVSAWSTVTSVLRTRGSLGSRLHRGDDGWWYGYAQWPDAARRSQAFSAATDDDGGYTAASQVMREAIVESTPEVALDVRADFLVAGG